MLFFDIDNIRIRLYADMLIRLYCFRTDLLTREHVWYPHMRTREQAAIVTHIPVNIMHTFLGTCMFQYFEHFSGSEKEGSTSLSLERFLGRGSLGPNWNAYAPTTQIARARRDHEKVR